MLEINESELPIALYNLVHVEDAVCMAEAHKEGSVMSSSSTLFFFQQLKTDRPDFSSTDSSAPKLEESTSFRAPVGSFTRTANQNQSD